MIATAALGHANGLQDANQSASRRAPIYMALPVAAGVFEPLGYVLRPEVGAISTAGSSIIVALSAVALKRLRLPPS